jgi:hypothetical protein
MKVSFPFFQTILKCGKTIQGISIKEAMPPNGAPRREDGWKRHIWGGVYLESIPLKVTSRSFMLEFSSPAFTTASSQRLPAPQSRWCHSCCGSSRFGRAAWTCKRLPRQHRMSSWSGPRRVHHYSLWGLRGPTWLLGDVSTAHDFRWLWSGPASIERIASCVSMIHWPMKS